MAGTRRISPRAMRGSQSRFCCSVPPSRMARADRTADVRCGPGAGPRPSSSKRTPASVKEPPSPPYSSGMRMPSQPVAASCPQGSRGVVSSGEAICKSTSLGYSCDTRRRAAAFSISCSGVRERSISVLWVVQGWRQVARPRAPASLEACTSRERRRVRVPRDRCRCGGP